MYKLFDDLCEGLIKQGWRDKGGSNVFRIMEKDENGIKLYMDNYDKPNHIVVRYSYYRKEI